MKSHWVCKQNSEAHPMSKSRIPTQNELNGVFVDYFSHIILFEDIYTRIVY